MRVRTYNKHVVQRVPGTKRIKKDENGNPELGDIVKTKVRETPESIEILNEGWDNEDHPISYYYVQVEQKADKKIVKSEERKGLEKEATDLGIKFRDNIGDAKLKEKINQIKEG